MTDIRVPPTHTDEGVRAARAIRGELPGTGVLVLSQHAEERYAVALLGDSAAGLGYLLKDRVVEPRVFVDAVRSVAAGGSVLDPEVVAQMLDRARPQRLLARLTDAELDVLARMAEGESNHTIAAGPGASERAVDRIVLSVFSKLDLPATGERHRRVLAVLTYLRASRIQVTRRRVRRLRR